MYSDPAPEVIHRLRTACGHLGGITQMIEAGQSCEQILYQLGAVQGAIREIGLIILEKEIIISSSIILSDNGDDDEKIAAARRILELFDLLYKNPRKTHMEKTI
jgi:DNA-binding FrmR family transcriptional regulator